MPKDSRICQSLTINYFPSTFEILTFSLDTGNSSTGRLYNITQDSRFQRAIQDIRDEYESEQENIVARLKHQHATKIGSLEAENQRLKEAMFERDAGLKNAEMTANRSS